ncbi:MAG: hypothetical protein GX431_09430 [Bacteroidales bacterium]|jgi:hypothetical protein|nr:hypothetical protein [Bacteroidales bacterium]
MDNTPEGRKLEIGPEILNKLNSTRKWTTFLSVLGFIFLGLVIIGGLAAGLFLTIFKTSENALGFPESLLTITALVVGLIYFFPVLFLFRFSRNTRDAIHNLDNVKLTKGFRNLYLFFKIIGIIVIMVVLIYIIALAVSGASLTFVNGI